MIRIRYADLPEGLYARAEAQGRHAEIYLRPGLTPAQRREGVRRARRAARMGYGPRLPATAVQAAVARDRMRITMRNVTAAVRQHMVPSALLTAVLATAVVSYVLFVSVSIRFTHTPPVQALIPHPGLPAALAPPAPPASRTGRAQGGRPGADAPRRGPSAPGTRGTPGTAHSPSPHASSPVPGLTPPPTPAASPSRSPGPLPSPSPSSGGTCVNLGPLGICLSM